ncbi:phosphate ABC transporter permease PstA [Candidatus Nucleicultrix amoebiphila]|uniref:Phosphate transport system permease protein PstA n=1 Tax=Candidatus Nucleicultrix amoebiphila FS5 TaxID=1414854 RepID=A0A1W6N4M6_9PROT|nr:phosphate ABC transporter permease PstA [Candidatus Nucleicultrix amoebiphila]ARN84716.1 hypothetical protein GQ61_04710 [Candidatus Nucleicultrix amoebiphila FS5]
MLYKTRDHKNLTKKRYNMDRYFRWLCRTALLIVLLFLMILSGGIIIKGLPAFTQTQIAFNAINVEETTPYDRHLRLVIEDTYPNINSDDRAALKQFIDLGARKILVQSKKGPFHDHTLWLPASDIFEYLLVNNDLLPPEIKVRFKTHLVWAEKLEKDGRVKTAFNTGFFTQSDSRNPKTAGIFGGLIGTAYLLLITLLLAFPIGVLAAIYLEEFAHKNRFTSFLEINISNLASVPSIVFGLLGLAIFLNFFHLPRSSSLVGGMTLALMTLPTIIVTARTSLRSVPASIRDAAFGLGASKVQTTFHQVLPLALPGILTGTLIGLARALGETAPLLMIGMMAFIVDIPQSPLDPAAALPVQIFTWSKNPEPGFMVDAAAAIIVLMLFLGFINLIAILLRRKFEYKYS